MPNAVSYHNYDKPSHVDKFRGFLKFDFVCPRGVTEWKEHADFGDANRAYEENGVSEIISPVFSIISSKRGYSTTGYFQCTHCILKFESCQKWWYDARFQRPLSHVRALICSALNITNITRIHCYYPISHLHKKKHSANWFNCIYVLTYFISKHNKCLISHT